MTQMETLQADEALSPLFTPFQLGELNLQSHRDGADDALFGGGRHSRPAWRILPPPRRQWGGAYHQRGHRH